MHGAGGNFGIVTEFEFRLNPLGLTVLAGPISWLMEETPNVLRFYRDWIIDTTQTAEDSTRSVSGERLRALKRQYDPDNFFRLNQNIPPA